jgi:NADH-quinone oxidoreductase subunit K
MVINLINYLVVNTILFLIGRLGLVLNRKNILIILMSVELMLLAVNMNFVVFSVYGDEILGQMFTLLVLTVAAAESSIGLAILLVYYRVRGTIAVERVQTMRG